jgi:hypothetical protein
MKKRREPTIEQLKALYADAISGGRPRLVEAHVLSRLIAEREGLPAELLPVQTVPTPPRVRKLYRQQEPE